MPQDNTLGAPTEGLGQTVTFAANGGRGVPQTTSSQRQAVRNNSSGGGAVLTARALQIPDSGGDATFKALAKLGGEAIRPHLEAERTASYVQGMQKAAQGQAIAEIVDEQPWYSKLFGATSLVDGARAYTASAKALSIAADMEANMSELRKMTGAEFGEYSAKQLTAANTGDAVTDMMISQQVSATLPAVMKGQTKAHIRYTQEVFEESIKSKARAAFSLLGTVGAQSRQPGATKENTDVLGAFIGALDVFQVPGEMDKTLHDKLIAESAIQSITDGNFDTYKFMKDSSKLARIDPTAAYHVERAYRAKSAEAKSRISPSLMQELADFGRMSAFPDRFKEADILSARDKLNEGYSTETGDPDQLVDTRLTVQELAQLASVRDQQAAALRRAISESSTKTDKARHTEALIQQDAERMVNGDSGRPWPLLAATSAEERVRWEEVHRRLASLPPEVQVTKTAQVRATQAAAGVVDKDGQQVMQYNASRILSGVYGVAGAEAMHTLYQRDYLPLLKAGGAQGEVVTHAYFGAHAEKLAEYHKLAKGQQLNEQQQQVYMTSVIAPSEATKPATIAGKARTAYVKELADSDFMNNSGLFGFATATRNPDGLFDMIAAYLPHGVEDKAQALKIAAQRTPGLTVVGGQYWRRPEGATPIDQYLRMNINPEGIRADASHIDADFSAAVDKIAAKTQLKDPIVRQLPDVNGIPVMYIQGTAWDESTQYHFFGPADLHLTKKPVPPQRKVPTRDLRAIRPK